MKIREISQNLTEASFIDRLKSGLGNMRAGMQASAQQRAGNEFNKGIADRVFNTWNQFVTTVPPGADPNQALVNFVNNQFHELKATAVPAPRLTNITDTARAKNYILQRTQEYVGQRMSPTRTSAPTSQMDASYPNPIGAADVEDRYGRTYGYDTTKNKNGAGWYKDETSEKITNANDIQTLNKLYYDAKRAFRAGQGQSPDVPEPTDSEIALVAKDPQQMDLFTGTASGPKKPLPPDQARLARYAISWSQSMATNQPTSQITTVVGQPTPAAAPTANPGTTPKSNVLPLTSKKPPVTESKQLNEGGNEIPNAEPVPQEDVPQVVNLAKRALPKELLANLQVDIGSGGYKVQSGDIDLMVEAQDVVNFFNTGSLPDPLKAAKVMLRKHFEAQGIYSSITGRNVHIGVEYAQQATNKKSVGQVDVMVIHEAAIVAPWHQHGPRGMYSDPNFKANEIFILISSIAKHLGLKFDPFAAKLVKRDTGEVVGRTRDEVAKILLNPKAKESDLDSVGSMLRALEFDADREGKLAQAKADAAKGLIRLPESAPFNTAAHYRKISDVVA